MGKLRVGVVGVGYLGRFHAEKYARLPDVELVGVVDTDERRARDIAASVGAAPFSDHRALIPLVDAVSVAVSTPAHFAVGRDFLSNDVDVLIEKPMTATLEEADTLLALAEAKGRILQVGHLERFNPVVLALEGRIRQPRFIESHRLSRYKLRCNDVSVVLDLMIHDIDIILNIVQSKLRRISAAGTPVVTGHVDIANARLEFENGCAANVTASRVSMADERKLRLFQPDAVISVDFARHEIVVASPDAEACSLSGIDDEFPDVSQERLPADDLPGLHVNRMCFTKSDALDAEIRAFVHSVDTRRTPAVTGRMGRDALMIALRIQEQILSGTPAATGLVT